MYEIKAADMSSRIATPERKNLELLLSKLKRYVLSMLTSALYRMSKGILAYKSSGGKNLHFLHLNKLSLLISIVGETYIESLQSQLTQLKFVFSDFFINLLH